MKGKHIIGLVILLEIFFLAYTTINSNLPSKFQYSKETNTKIKDILKDFKSYKKEVSSTPILDLTGLKIDTLSRYLIKEARKESVKEISLKINEFEYFPMELQYLSSLKSINLSYNKIKTIPTEIKKLDQITHLDLSNNELKQFPIAILKLKNLQYLNLSNNDLKSLPSEIRKLEQLEQFVFTSHTKNTNALRLELEQLLPNTILHLGKN